MGRSPRAIAGLALLAAAVVAGPAAALTVPPDPALAASPSARPAPVAKKPTRKVPRFVFTFNGRGFGHGIGMSQYGAYGAALAGQSAQQILARYYRGTSLGSVAAIPVRVLLATSATSLALDADGAWSVTAEGSPLAAGRPLPPNAPVQVTRLGPGGVIVTDATGTELLRAPGPVLFATADAASTTGLAGVRYRGAIRVLADAAGLSAVNHVDLEQYLMGVVPREMPTRWGDVAPAALEAQAIAARSYAIATRRTGGSFDMYADERSQVYGGASAEDPRTTRAVAVTAGRVVTFGGAIVTTFFFSTSGGRTENVENVFAADPRPYLVSVADRAFDATSPHHVWKDPKTFSDAQLARLLGTRRPVLSIRVLQRGVSPRVKLVRITTRSGGVKEMRGVDVRRALGLRDTWFSPKRRVLTPATLKLVARSARPR